MGPPFLAFTLAARNYLGMASVLAASLRAHCPGIEFRCFVVDGFDGEADLPEALRGRAVDCRGLGIARFEEMAFKYDVVEFSTALKPFVFRHLLEGGCGAAVFFDPDVKLFDGLAWLEERLRSRSIVVTPHLLDAGRNGWAAAERTAAIALDRFLEAGDFNLGFAAVRNDAAGNAFVSWWGEALAERCFLEPARGLCVDQKWVDLAPGFFGEHLDIVRDAGANVAYWNLHERSLDGSAAEGYTVNGGRLRFMHFSDIARTTTGPDPSSKLGQAARHIDPSTRPACAEIYGAYKRELDAAGHAAIGARFPYRFDRFESGITINKLHRRLYAALVAKESLPDPFARAGRFHRWLERSGLLETGFTAPTVRASDVEHLAAKRRIVEAAFALLFRCLGTRRYLALLGEMRRISALDNNLFLLRGRPD